MNTSFERSKPLIGLIIIAIIIIGGLYYYNKPKSYQERREEEIARKNNLKSKLTKDCQMKLAAKAIEETFGKDVTYEIKKTDYYLLSEYVGNSTAEGTLKGKIKGTEGEYHFKLRTAIEQETPKYSYLRIDELAVYPKGSPYYAYHLQYGKEMDIEEENIKIKKSETEKAEKTELNVVVDGITVEFVKYENDNAWYYSKKELNPEQIYEVVKQRGGSAIHFDSKREDYATYINSTRCIIFNYMKDEIYKISSVGTLDKI